MKKAISITLAGLVFNIEEDAYQKLDRYLNSIRRHYQDNNEEKEILADIESSLAEKFSGKLKNGRQAITSLEVEEAVKVMGTIEEIEDEPSVISQLSGVSSEPLATRKLYRNPDDAIIAGVCSGLAAYFGLDPVYIRLFFILLVFINGLGLLAYVALWVIMPPAKTNAQKLVMQGEPVNLKKIEQAVKEKSKLVKEEGQAMLNNLSRRQGGFYKLLSFPVRLIEASFGFFKKIFKVLVPVLSVILGLGLIISAVAGLLGLTVASGLALFNINSPYLVSDLPLSLLAASPFYYAAVLSIYFTVLVPLVFLVVLGWTLIRRSNCFNGLFSGLLFGLWLIAIAGLAVAAADLGPKINNYFATSQEQAKVSRVYDYQDFSKLYLGGTIQATVKPGETFSLSAEGREIDLDRLSFNIQDGQLQITQKSRSTKGKICFFCWDRPVKMLITLPRLESYVGVNRSQADISGFDEDIYVSLGEAAQSQIILSGQNLICSLSGVVSQLNLSGLAKAVDCRLNGQARLQTVDFKVDEIKLKQSVLAKVYLVGQGNYLAAELKDLSRLQAFNWQSLQGEITVFDNGRAEVYVLEKLNASSLDNGRVFYKGQPDQLNKQEENNGRVQKKSADDYSQDYYNQSSDNNLIIKFDSQIYSPTMSSIRGIALTPDYQASYPMEYEWYADKGSLVEDWSRPEYLNRLVNQGQTVYWTFGPADKLTSQDGPITVYLKAKNKMEGQIEDTAVLELNWSDPITVQVKQ